MKNIDDKSIDMILCDLPYGVTQNKKDAVIPFVPLWKHYERIIKDTGAIVLTAQGSFYVDLVNSNKKLFRYDLIWDKQLTSGFLNAKRQPLRQHENIAVFYKKQPTYNPQFTEGNPLHGKGTAYKTKELKNNNYGEFTAIEDYRKGSTQKYPTSILRFPKPHPSMAIHPTQKSMELFKWLIKTYTNENDLVLDNAIGSGTTAIACIKTNRNYIGFEIDGTYYDMARERIIENTKKVI
jgi:site-specific DNA-methyltransferase (adenine-specific)